MERREKRGQGQYLAARQTLEERAGKSYLRRQIGIRKTARGRGTMRKASMNITHQYNQEGKERNYGQGKEGRQGHHQQC